VIPCILFLGKRPHDQFYWTRAKDLRRFGRYAPAAKQKPPFENDTIESRLYNSKDLTQDDWVFLNALEKSIFQKLHSLPKLKSVVKDVFLGPPAGKPFYFEIKKKARNGLVTVRSSATKKEYQIERKAFLTYVRGRDIAPYYATAEKALLLYPYEKQDGKAKLIEWPRFKKLFPKAAAYLQENKKELSQRAQVKNKPNKWYAFAL